MSSDRLLICAIPSVPTQVPIPMLATAADALPAISAQVFCVQIAAVNVWAETASVVAKVML